MARIAVLGAGFQGVCTAAELAARGYRIDLYDKNPLPLTQAGFNNEGKIHLGFVYANDTDLKTAARLLQGGIRFYHILQRWLDLDTETFRTSSPFYYGIHARSMLSRDRILDYFHRLDRLYKDVSGAIGLSYMDQKNDSIYEILAREDYSDCFNQDKVISAIKTSECAVDVTRLCLKLRGFIESHPRINLINNTTIDNVSRKDGSGLTVACQNSGHAFTQDYDHIINTLWDGRLEIDATMGLVPDRPWIYRYKVGLEVELETENPRIPSITLIHGPYGDIVNYDQRRIYLSWYPAGMITTSYDIKAPDVASLLTPEKLEEISEVSLRELSDLCPPAHELFHRNIVSKIYKSGFIIAWGKTDIDDINSELHYRHDIGIHSHGNYHSIDTGKFTMAPHFAVEVCDRIQGHI